jgi:DNA invertase Pin-like site-specific DNA recombinase
MSLAFSYLRFSSPQQAKGDSIRRQTEATADWCERHGVALDTSLSLRDEGVSAFRGKHRENPDVNGLGAFLAAVNGGRVPPGSFLVLENLDRLTREAIVPAVNLFTGLLLAGIRIVQLRPAEQVFTSGADMTGVMLALVELSRGHSESAIKSQRIAAVWSKKRKEADKKVLTRRLPAWVELVDGKLVLNREKAAAVRRVYKMARDGMGAATIAKTLNAEKVPVIGREQYKSRAVLWSESVVLNILRSRAAIGEYQPHVGVRSERKPIGEPVLNYYPPVVTADEWHATQAALKSRATVGRGRRGKHINIFAGLLRDARDGGSLSYFHQSDRNPILVPVGVKYGRGGTWVSFPADQFEDAILKKLVEIKPREVFGKDTDGNKVEALAGRLAELDAVIKKWTDDIDSLELADVVRKKLVELGAQRKALAAELNAARLEDSDPAAGAWGRFRSLAAALKKDSSDETRTAIRNALRRAVEGVWCVFAGDRRIRLAAVRVQFNGTDQHRDYVIACSPVRVNAKGKRERCSEVQSFAEAGAGPLDLRRPADVAKVERLLESLKLDQ